MKKNGFTLSELLIALGVVAVASALMAPQITKIMPDKAKLKVISINSKIEQETDRLVSNDAIYWCDDNSVQGLACEGQAMTRELNNAMYSGNDKYKNLMVHYLDLTEDNSLAGFTHVSSDGVYWNFQRNADASGNLENVIITIDINGEKGPNSIFGQNNITKNNDRFRFNVDEYGNVSPADALTAAYISKNNTKFNDKKGDRQRATRIFERNADYRNF